MFSATLAVYSTKANICRRCCEPGHFARNCDKVLDPPSVPDPPSVDDAAASADVPSSVSILADLQIVLSDNESLSSAFPPDVELADPDVSPRAVKRPHSTSDPATSTEEYLATPGYSKDAFMFNGGDCLAIIDMRHLTYRVLHDTTTPEMYRKCYYEDVPLSKRVPAPSVFPYDRSRPPDNIILDHDVVPASFPVGSPPIC